MIRAILWDVDGTLLDFHAAEKNAIRACFAELGLGECTDEQIARYSVINKKYWKRMEDGEITKQEVLNGRFAEFFASEGVNGDVEAFNMLYQIRLGDTIVFIDEADRLLADLRGRVKQYAVTNGTKRAQDRKLRLSGLDRLFEGIFISDEIGAEKPSREFFDHVFAHIEPFEKDEILIVGDSLSSDIRGGNVAGIRTCWVNPGHAPRNPEIHIDFEIEALAQLPALLESM